MMGPCTRADWEEALATMGECLQAEQATARLVVFGSVANILCGQSARTTIDLDVWSPLSRFDRRVLQRATQAAGLLFDPKSVLEPTTPYLQIVELGIVQLGQFTPVEIATFGGLTICRPPAENLVASKVGRAQPQDIEDMIWLIGRYGVEKEDVIKVIQKWPRVPRAVALENLVFLDLLS